MTLIFGLIVAALGLIFCEVLLPGGVLGLVAAGCIIAATAIAGSQYGILAGTAVLFGSLVAALILTVIEFRYFAKTRYGQRFFLKHAVVGHSNTAKADASVIGQTGTTLTRLNPSGKIEVAGRTYEAFSQDGYIESGESVKIVSQDSFKLIIQKL